MGPVPGCRESLSSVKIYRNFKEAATLKLSGSAEGLHGGTLLGVRSADYVTFYSWATAQVGPVQPDLHRQHCKAPAALQGLPAERLQPRPEQLVWGRPCRRSSCCQCCSTGPRSLRCAPASLPAQVVRRIDVVVKDIKWAEAGELVAIISEASFYVLRFNREAVEAAQGATLPEGRPGGGFRPAARCPRSCAHRCAGWRRRASPPGPLTSTWALPFPALPLGSPSTAPRGPA